MNARRKVAALFAVMLSFTFATTLAQGADETPQNNQNNAVDPALTQTVTSDEQIVPLGNPVELNAGHVDMGPLLIDGKWDLYARDDTTATPMWRNVEEVVFRVVDAAKQQIPSNPEYQFIQADGPVWVIPQQELRGALWLGWNTQSPEVVKQVNGGVDLIFEGHQGPGDFHVFIQAGNFAGPQQLWDSTKTQAQPIHVELNTHTHANWVFTKPGVHLVRLTAQAQLQNGEKVSQTKILRFAVSDQADAERALAEKWNTEHTADSEVSAAQPSAIDQNNALPFILGGVIIALIIVVIGTVFALRKRGENAKNAAEIMADGNFDAEK
ncbi:choice-of-anchor M domain-containing protein [Arcanobacterium hippocoleae]|uniref:Surface-anchored protein n=1 Tax=Arcanobacterium hippocoleae TaxID=149017 RepID=A0ABU1T259_9ACTO|nr:choice-of-anchor M domain-containing protein [Arcanobacterium hippocoleae]MDR6938956.1 surface-anchored protein [Arcanobacterium hippocoleae]